ncbi:MAG TPA: hypothetical protein VFS71_19930 [Flavobacterium sp.]|uniref:hypothetical protein n=1 Tax=Flavobacterium sp. TaxID=239 RepID=UPI002DBF29F7|nr:hypothetical protein [Flavobacterium sp.]HEU4791965.1 hypothetical protein [Flavobacterium sp.]
MERIATYIIFILPILQILLYLYVDFKKINNKKKYVFISILLTYFFIPFIINYLSKSEKESGCLLPLISMFGAIWFIGMCFTIIAHLIYVAYTKVKSLILKRKPNG